ncbi:MAG: TM2 domain-containing protein [Ignavibacteria bacterium]|jgi:TM2 domain-containing membrane protein YozV|nr:TM2 domain-containing protein [Ignavibacteria bacterium]
MANVFNYLPDLDSDELVYVNSLVSPMTNEQAQQFALIYRSRRKDPQTIMILTLCGFLTFIVPSAGLQRFVTGKIGLGILYLLTGGLCFIGTIVDLVHYRRIASEYNQQQAYEVALMMQSMTPLA